MFVRFKNWLKARATGIIFSLEILPSVSSNSCLALSSPARELRESLRIFSINSRISAPWASLMVSPRKRPNILMLLRRVRYSCVIGTPKSKNKIRKLSIDIAKNRR